MWLEYILFLHHAFVRNNSERYDVLFFWFLSIVILHKTLVDHQDLLDTTGYWHGYRQDTEH